MYKIEKIIKRDILHFKAELQQLNTFRILFIKLKLFFLKNRIQDMLDDTCVHCYNSAYSCDER